MSILNRDEAPPLTIINPQGAGHFFLICEHAGNKIPQSLARLGLQDADLQAHIAWDIGIAGVSRHMSKHLDAILFEQTYSRLVCDCNRSSSAADFAPQTSESTSIPGNQNLSRVAIKQRIDEIYQPYHDAIRDALDNRQARDKTTFVAAMHSFTPTYLGIDRPWHVGVMFNRDPVFAKNIIALLKSETDYVIGENQPYALRDEVDYSIPVHGEKRGLPCVEFEIRNDLISRADDQKAWAELLSGIFERAAEGL